MAKIIMGYCKLCGNYKKLSKEHVPPSKAFNNGEFKLETINSYKTKDVNVWHQKTKYGGNYSYAFCEQCNNLTGSWYVPEYVKITKICAPYAHPTNAGRIVSIGTSGFFPLRVFKEALSIFCATSDTDISGDWNLTVSPALSSLGSAKPDMDISIAANYLPELRKFVLDKYAHKLQVPVRLYMFLVCNFKGRTTGIVKNWKVSTGKSLLFAEFSWAPIGWILVFDGELDEYLLDVTEWSKYEYREGLPLTLRLPALWVESRMPLDFRHPEEVSLLRQLNQSLIAARGIQKGS